MWMRSAPPTRGSISQTGLVKPLGPHHCAKCFGSVHASNTSARGASQDARDCHFTFGERLCLDGGHDVFFRLLLILTPARLAPA